MDGEVEWRVSVVGSSVDARTGTPQTCIKRLLIGESMRRSGVPCSSEKYSLTTPVRTSRA